MIAAICTVFKAKQAEGSSAVADMPIKDGTLTPQEKLYVDAVARTSDERYAAEKAGYRFPVQAVAKNRAKPAISREIQAEQEAALHNELVPLALGRLRKILEDDDIAPQHHIAAGKVVLGAAKGATDAATGKSLSEMNMAETEAMLTALRAEHARKQAETLEPIEPTQAEDDVFG